MCITLYTMAGNISCNDGLESSSQASSSSEGLVSNDTALSKRAISVREKLQDDTYSWIMKCLDMIFEYFLDKEERHEQVEKLTEVVFKFCSQDLEHNKAKCVFDTLCFTHPIKNCPKDFDFTKEYDKQMAKEGKTRKESVKKHPKYVRFVERVKELEKGKEISQTEAISIE